jgi:hypothetical protein
MNTPAHAIINLLLFPKQKREAYPLIVIVSAMIPDLPMVIFYFWARFRGLSEHDIWRTAYFNPTWQAVFDSFHSFPLLGIAWFIAWRANMKVLSLCFASMFLHSCFDFPVHHSDAHHHFFPISSWQFHSPISYWEPAYHGLIISILELGVVIIGSLWLGKNTTNQRLRIGVSWIALLYLAYWGFVSIMWMR